VLFKPTTSGAPAGRYRLEQRDRDGGPARRGGGKGAAAWHSIHLSLHQPAVDPQWMGGKSQQAHRGLLRAHKYRERQASGGAASAVCTPAQG